MFRSKQSCVVGALTGFLLTLSVPGLATAAPINGGGVAIATPQVPITDVRYRRAIPPAAVLGLFGAVLGAAIANSNYDNYDNYSYYAYGQPYGYGYGGGGRVRGGGGHARGGGGHRGGGHHK